MSPLLIAIFCRIKPRIGYRYMSSSDHSVSKLLSRLPSPPAGKTGWPWIVESSSSSVDSVEAGLFPKISIVTPSFNQSEYIEETIRSVLLQGYPNLEYLIIDGGSTDGSVEIIKKYEKWIDFWVTEPDLGQSHAINKGFHNASGEWGNWINSDDLLCEGALGNFPVSSLDDAKFYIGSCVFVDREGCAFKEHRGNVESVEDLIRIPDVWRSDEYIPQPSALFPLNRYWEVGGINILNHYTMDYELWGKLMLLGLDVEYIPENVSKFRVYEDQKTFDFVSVTESLVNDAMNILDNAESMNQTKKDKIKVQINRHLKAVRTGGKGRLVDWGFPGPVIRHLRSLRSWLSSLFRGRWGRENFI